ncbi:MAG TPA: preprotein translocase subunit SecG [Candidatus Acidoferrales bacterium]|nr:preprotein translocase subunit SecG [Candidatus Acidoferrales bacterium]
MITLVTIVHVIVCLALVVIVLLQTGKGADIGAVFGGSSSTIFGSSGAGNFLTRLTTGLAIVFMITSLTLGYFSVKKPTSSVLERAARPAPASRAEPQAAPGPAERSSGPGAQAEKPSPGKAPAP